MILCPVDSFGQPYAEERRPLPVWKAIERRQKQDARQWWLITQPDHAALAADLAQLLVCAFPRLGPDVIRAIALHDDGWAPFDREPVPDPMVRGKINPRPLSFVEMRPPAFLQAWRASIERAEQDAPIGGILVSKHFCRIAQMHTPSSQETEENHQMIMEFLDQETNRQEQLFRQQSHPPEEIERLVDVLQFLDLLSLYLCCGSQRNVEFPQKFRGQTICIRPESGLFRTDPPLFGGGVSLGVTACAYPAIGAPATQIPLLIA